MMMMDRLWYIEILFMLQKNKISSPKVASMFSSYTNIDVFEKELNSTPNTKSWLSAMKVNWHFKLKQIY